MAVLNGKLYFSWVQRSRLCIPGPTRNSAISKWQLALRKRRALPALIRVHQLLSAVRVFSVLLSSVPQCLRGENGGCR